MALGGWDRTFAGLEKESSGVNEDLGGRGKVFVPRWGGPDRAEAGVSSGARGTKTLPRPPRPPPSWRELASAYHFAIISCSGGSTSPTRTGPGMVRRSGRCRLIAEHAIPLVLTSANPYTCHRIGLTLQRHGCRWVADLPRSPHVLSSHALALCGGPRPPWLELAAATHADAVTVASSAIGMILADSYGEAIGRRVRFIPTGLDEELLGPEADAETAPRPFPYLLFTGEFLPDYGQEWFDIFAEALQRPEVRPAS